MLMPPNAEPRAALIEEAAQLLAHPAEAEGGLQSKEGFGQEVFREIVEGCCAIAFIFEGCAPTILFE